MLDTKGKIAFILVLIGGINWLFVGLFKISLMGVLLGGQTSFLARLLYILIGVSACYLIYFFWIAKKK